MTVTVSGLRAEANRLRELGWSYRRIAGELQCRHNLNILVAYRLAHGWTQEEAARRWNERWSGEQPPKTGKSFSYWEAWPAPGGRTPSPATLRRLAELYLCRPGELLDGEDFSAGDANADGTSSTGAGAGADAGAGDAGAGVAPVRLPLPLPQGDPPRGAPAGHEDRAGVAASGVGKISEARLRLMVLQMDATQLYERLVALELAGQAVA